MKLLRFFAGLLFSFHIIAVMCCLFPPQTVFQDSLVGPFLPYLKLIHAAQGWPMFTAVPNSQPVHFKIHAETEDGQWLSLPPMLPGFREMDHSLRSLLYVSYTVDSSIDHLEAYANRVCDALTREKRLRIHRIYLHVFNTETRGFDKIRQDGFPSRNRLRALGPWYCQTKLTSPLVKRQ